MTIYLLIFSFYSLNYCTPDLTYSSSVAKYVRIIFSRQQFIIFSSVARLSILRVSYPLVFLTNNRAYNSRVDTIIMVLIQICVPLFFRVHKLRFLYKFFCYFNSFVGFFFSLPVCLTDHERFSLIVWKSVDDGRVYIIELALGLTEIRENSRIRSHRTHYKSYGFLPRWYCTRTVFIDSCPPPTQTRLLTLEV